MDLFSRHLRWPTKNKIEHYLSVKFYTSRTHGQEDGFDIWKTSHSFAAIFDIGAKVGQSTVNFRKSLPVAFESIRKLLVSFGYIVFGVHDQQLERSGGAQLRYANICFCNEGGIVKK